MDTNIDKYLTVQEAADQLGVQYYTLLSWVKKDVGNVLSHDLAVKKSAWLIHESAIERLQHMIDYGVISSEKIS